MRLTEQQMKEDDERWADRDIITELQFCGRDVRPYNQTTKMDVRFNAWLCRKALKLMKDIARIRLNGSGKWEFIGDNMFMCTSCGATYTVRQLECLKQRVADPYLPPYCPNCGKYNNGDVEQPDKKEEGKR